MKCSKCGNDLGLESDSVEKGKYCSSCEKLDFPKSNSIEEVLRWIVQDRGVNVFQNSGVINAILSDLAPKDEKGRIKIKNAMAVGAGEYFYGIVQQGTLNDVSRKQFLSTLSSDGFTIEFCNFIFDVFAYSINQSVAVQEKETSKTSANDSYKNIAVNTEQNNKNVSHNTKTDIKRVKGEEIVKGEKTSPDGTIYKGELLDNMCHGKGVMIWPNGDKFEGEFWKGKSRKGVYTFASGSIYKGEMSDGKSHEKGVMIWTNGDKFEGEFWKGKPKKGLCSFANGLIYKGELSDGKSHGKGVRIWPNGDKFEGEFWKDEPKKGVYTFADGTIFEGVYMGNFGNKKGVMTWPDGTVFDGEWRDYKYNGKGMKTLPNGEQYLQIFYQGNLISEKKLI